MAGKQSPKPEDQTQWGSDLPANADSLPEPKAKIKTRSDKLGEKTDLAMTDLTISDAEEPPSVKVAVGKRTLEVLQSLYPKPNFEERRKSIDWASFVYGMSRAGFSARQNHGSEYSFEPVYTCVWYGRCRIVFHKPHPEPKYKAWQLLGIGKRMKKWFDWNADTFELLDTKPRT